MFNSCGQSVHFGTEYAVNLKTEIENGAMALSKLCSVPKADRTEANSKEILENEKKINNAVFRLYRLTPGEVSLGGELLSATLA